VEPRWCYFLSGVAAILKMAADEMLKLPKTVQNVQINDQKVSFVGRF